MAEAGGFGVFRDVVDARLVPDVIEIHVAGLLNSAVQRHASVAALHPAVKKAAVKIRPAAATDAEILVNGVGGKPRQRDDGFERRAGSELGLNGAIEQGVVG